MRLRGICALVMAVAASSLVLEPVGAHARSGNVAALQVALKALNLYGGHIDGVRGPGTARAIRRLQRRRHLAVDGVAGRRTRRALGRRGRPRLGTRVLRRGRRGWDVAALQFMLRRRGARPGSIDGGFGGATSTAVRRFQRRAALTADGVVGPSTLRALRRSRPGRGRRARRRTPSAGGPVVFFRPLNYRIGDGFGMRWGRPHQGLDFTAGMGARVGAAGRGVVSYAGWNAGGYGNLVIVDHRLGFQTYYAHLSRVTSYVGESVNGGTRVGLVGSTGHSTGPHLHFEVRLNGIPIDPLPRLLGGAASASATRSAPAHGGCEKAGLERQRLRTNGREPAAVC
ncbi:MAG: peptidoglycan-binding protein [Thermoleophilaceae bacterium]